MQIETASCYQATERLNMESTFAPIVMFVYCRPDHAQQTVEALLRNKEASKTDLYIYSDYPKNAKARKGVEETRKYIHKITGFKTINIIKREENWGLAKSLVDGITTIANQYGRVIVIEDDITVSEYCLQYFNDGLILYKDDEQMASLHAYMYPHNAKLPDTFLIKGADCWGWATWKRAWDKFCNDPVLLRQRLIESKCIREFEFDYSFPYMKMLQNRIDGKNSSWAICWYASAFLNNMYTLYPNVSMAEQIGMDGVGATHSSVTNAYDVKLAEKPIKLTPIATYENSEQGVSVFKSFFIHNCLSWKGRIIRIIKLLFKPNE